HEADDSVAELCVELGKEGIISSLQPAIPDLVRDDPGFPHEQRLTERLTLVNSDQESIPLVAGKRGLRLAVVVIFAKIDAGQRVNQAVVGVGGAALSATDRAEADHVVVVYRFDHTGDVLRPVPKSLCRALDQGAIAADLVLDLGLVDQLPSSEERRRGNA